MDHRREFVRGGVAAFTVGFAAPAFLADIAQAQGALRRNLVVLYLSGGNDSLSTRDAVHRSAYYARRPTIAMPAANVLQIGTDRAGNAARTQSAAHRAPDDFQRRPARDDPAYRLQELEPLALPGHGHLVHRRSLFAAGYGMARPLSRSPARAGRSPDGVVHRPRDAADAAGADGRRCLDSERLRLRVREPERRRDASAAQGAATRIASHLPLDSRTSHS